MHPPEDARRAPTTRPLILWLAARRRAHSPCSASCSTATSRTAARLAVDGIRNLTYPNAEGNVFAWYSTIVLAAIGVGFLLIAAATRGSRPLDLAVHRHGRRSRSCSRPTRPRILHERLANFASALGLSSAVRLSMAAGRRAARRSSSGSCCCGIARGHRPGLRRGLLMAGTVFLAGAVGGGGARRAHRQKVDVGSGQRTRGHRPRRSRSSSRRASRSSVRSSRFAPCSRT